MCGMWLGSFSPCGDDMVPNTVGELYMIYNRRWTFGDVVNAIKVPAETFQHVYVDIQTVINVPAETEINVCNGFNEIRFRRFVTTN
jgi:hypothetical protein